MNAKFEVSLRNLEKELFSLGILFRRNPSVSRSFDFAKVRDASFFDYWASYYRENWYDFQFKDFSLLSFNKNGKGEETFIYIGCPVDCPLSENDYYANERYRLSGEPYEDYVLSCPKVESVPYLRYDNAINQYNPGLHPANHFHFGFGQKNRVGSVLYFDIVAFVAMVLRQFYPDIWSKVLNGSKSYPLLYGHKSKLKGISDDYYNGLDVSHDMYLK